MYQKTPQGKLSQKKSKAKIDKEVLKLYGKKFRERSKQDVIFKYSNGLNECACCKESFIEFLTLDHITGFKNAPKDSPRDGCKLYRWLIRNNYPDGFRVLCLNCNFSIGLYGYCPHQKKEE